MISTSVLLLLHYRKTEKTSELSDFGHNLTKYNHQVLNLSFVSTAEQRLSDCCYTQRYNSITIEYNFSQRVYFFDVYARQGSLTIYTLRIPFC